MSYSGCFGNCINSFDEDGYSLIDLFTDTSDFACVEEDSELLTLDDFLDKLGTNVDTIKEITKINECDFLFNKERKICMLYNREKDVHYFFQEKKEKLKQKLKL